MSGWLYLIRNRDLYKIGITKSFDKRMRQLKPDNVIAKLYSSDFVKLERELHKRYRKFRIPQTEYFRLTDSHVKEIKLRICKLDYPIRFTFEIFIKALFLVLFIFFVIFILISLNINDFNIVIAKSVLLMERLLFGISFLSLLSNSGKYLSISGELKYRLSRLIIYILFALLFRLTSQFVR